MLDYIFKSVGYSEFPIQDNLIYTEPFCNTNVKRAKASELFFEAYGINRLLTLSEPLVTMYNHQSASDSLDEFSTKFGLIVSVSHKCCMVIPIVDGKADFQWSRRMNIGVSDSFNFMSKVFALKYDYLGTKMNYPTVKVSCTCANSDHL